MAFDRNYDALIALAADMAQYEGGYLDSDGQKVAAQARGNYAAERNKVAYDILAEKPDLDLVYTRIRGDLASIAEENEGFDDLCTFVANDLIEKLQEESQKSGAWRATKRYAAPAFLGTLAIAYFAMFFINDLTIDQPMDNKDGLIQRAAAFDKASTYDDWMSTRTRRGGAIKGLLLWPWEPDDEELNAANEFAGLTLEGLQLLTDQGAACNTQTVLLQGEYLNEVQLDFVESVSELVQADATVWEEPAVMTLLPFMAEKYPCADAAGVAEGEAVE